MPTQAQYDDAFLVAGKAATIEIENAVAQVPPPFQPLAQQTIKQYWPQIQTAIHNVSNASVDAVLPKVA